MSRSTSGKTSEKGMTPEEYMRSLGLNPEGRNPKHASGGAFTTPHTFFSTFLFVFYVMMGGNPFFVLLANSSPIIEHESANTADPSEAALEALLARGLVRLGTHKLTVIYPVYRLFDKPVIHFVEVDLAVLVEKGHSFFGSKKYSLVNPLCGESQGGKESSFGLDNYSKLSYALLPMLPSSTSAPKAAFARGGGGGAVAFGGGGGCPADSVADRSRLTQVTKMTPDARNAFVLLILAKSRGGILLVRTKRDGCWGLPGGMVDAGETPWQAGKREFKEEIQSDLPRLDASDFGTESNEPIKFAWKHKNGSYTGIYCGKTTAFFSNFQRSFKPNHEICEIGVFTPQQILQMALGLDPINNLRDCASQSIITILLHLGLIV
jgi:8-oxo-dGTP pyrophosphatase MutT (NUDIX family)